VIANATGCSSIYGGNLPTTPYCTNAEGRGPTWANSLFEDNAEFGFGLQLAMEQRMRTARHLLKNASYRLTPGIVEALLGAEQRTEADFAAQRGRVAALRDILHGLEGSDVRRLEAVVDDLVRKSVWIVGGDGWAYDIGYGGLDHVLASGANVKVLVLDTEVYSNTGGQASKSTPIGAVAKFAAGGKASAKKDLAAIAMQYGHVYVAKVAFGAKDTQTITAFREAEEYDGPALIIAYSHCIAHGFPLHLGADQQRLAVDSGYWPLIRFDPRLADTGQAFKLDSPAPKIDLERFTANETRFSVLKSVAPERAAELKQRAQAQVRARAAHYRKLASNGSAESPAAPATGPAQSPAPPAPSPNPKP
jgi:pyruvate-ferredoxin/flavodoxin oxidoreductase